MKPEKTRYGSRAVSNWNLGLMLNKDNVITFLKKGAYTKAEFEELIAQTQFDSHEIKKRGMGFEVWLFKKSG